MNIAFGAPETRDLSIVTAKMFYLFKADGDVPKKSPFDNLDRDELVKKCKGLLLIAKNAKQAKDGESIPISFPNPTLYVKRTILTFIRLCRRKCQISERNREIGNAEARRQGEFEDDAGNC